jgi:hypothetical protein
MIGASTGGVLMKGERANLQLDELPADEAQPEMAKLKLLSADKIIAPTPEEVAPEDAQRVEFAHQMEENGMRQGRDLTVVASGPHKTYLTIYTAVSKTILFQIGEDKATMAKLKEAGFKRFTVSDPSLRGYSTVGSLIGTSLTGQDNAPGCNVQDECTRTWYF